MAVVERLKLPWIIPRGARLIPRRPRALLDAADATQKDFRDWNSASTRRRSAGTAGRARRRPSGDRNPSSTSASDPTFARDAARRTHGSRGSPLVRTCSWRGRALRRSPGSAPTRADPDAASLGDLVHVPNRPNPVTSVTAFGSKGRSTDAASSSASASTHRPSELLSAGSTALVAGHISPVPSGFVRRPRRPGSLRSRPRPSGCTVPITGQAVLRSSSRIVVPARENSAAPRGLLVVQLQRSPPASRSAATREGSDRERQQRRAAHREDVVQRVRPLRSRRSPRGRPTTGGNKSSVKMIARSAYKL